MSILVLEGMFMLLLIIIAIAIIFGKDLLALTVIYLSLIHISEPTRPY